MPFVTKSPHGFNDGTQRREVFHVDQYLAAPTTTGAGAIGALHTASVGVYES